MRKSPPVIDIAIRFWAKVNKTEGCWEWTGGLSSGGYGVFYRTGPRTSQPAHRASWEIHNGPIPAGMFVCHHCDNRKCVRLDHLFLGDQAANMLDARLKERLGSPDVRKRTPRSLRASHCRRGHLFTPENTYVTRALKRQCRTCSRAAWYAKYHLEKQLRHTA